MNILLVGYGKMGRAIEKIVQQRGHSVAGRIDVDNPHEWDSVNADVAIEFSHPDAAFANVTKCLERNIPVVCGTTGWLGRKPEIENLCQQRNGSFFYASNYSLGVNIFLKVNTFLARIMNGFEGYDVVIDEIHHTEKKDAPSGTAISIAEGILNEIKRKTKWVDHPGSASDLFIQSHRVGQVPGVHTVKYSSAIDDIEIKHTAHSREGFALGAVLVAEWLPGKKGCLTMDDYLKF